MYIPHIEVLMVKAVISGYYGYKNFGDETILSVLLEHLKTINVDSVILSGDVNYTKSVHNIDAVNRFDIKNVLKIIKNSDVLISGGGSLLQDVTSLKSLVYYAFVIALAILYRKKVIIFAQGIGPLKSKLSKLIVRFLLKYTAYVSVRDEESLSLLENWGIDADLVCDPVYSISVSDSVKEDAVGVQLRDFSTMNLNLLQKLAMFINAKFSDKKIEIFSLQYVQDYELALRFQNMLKNINPKIVTEIVTDDIINKISKLKYMIGMRYHALLIAIKSGVKTCAINYDIKVENLANNAKIPVISMEASENFENLYQELKILDTKNLLEYSNSKQFDWSDFDKTLIFK